MSDENMDIKCMIKEKIIREINKIYPEVEPLVKLAGMDKEGWIVSSLLEIELGEHKHFIRCENCMFYECDTIKRLKKKYPKIVEIWVTHGNSCSKFSPKGGT